jgi:hypothetical protein
VISSNARNKRSAVGCWVAGCGLPAYKPCNGAVCWASWRRATHSSKVKARKALTKIVRVNDILHRSRSHRFARSAAWAAKTAISSKLFVLT